jgi:ATP-dependent Clp protease, protease subunit
MTKPSRAGNKTQVSKERIARSMATMEDEGVLRMGAIDDDFLETFLVPLQELIQNDRVDTVKLFINSPGGDATWIGRAVSIIMQSPKPIIAVVDCAMSAAFVIACACHVRYCYPESFMMHHLTWTGMAGNHEELKSHAEGLRSVDEAVEEMLIKNTRITRKLLDEQRLLDWFITPKEAAELGIVHQVIQHKYAVKPAELPKIKGKK